MRSGDFTGALPLLQQAVRKLSGSGSADEAYADYNLAYSTLALGHCNDVLACSTGHRRFRGTARRSTGLRHDARKDCRCQPRRAAYCAS